MDIKCRKTECKYNDRFVCQAKKIDVDKTHICRTFEKDGEKAPDTTKLIFLKKWNMHLFAIAKILKLIVMKSVCLMMKGSAKQMAF